MAAFEIIALDPVVPQLRAPGSADTYLAPRAFDIEPGTLTSAVPVLDMGVTWNNSGVTFTGMRFNVTDTASNAASLLMDFRVGGASRLNVSKTGNIAAIGTLRLGSLTAPGALLDSFGASGLLGVFPDSSQEAARFKAPQSAHGGATFAFGISLSSTGSLGSNFYDNVIIAEAANTLAQRNGTNAQTFRTYGTFTDASNYRRVQLAMTTAGVATLRPEGAGTGASGNVLHISGLPTSNPGPGILWNNAGTPAIGT